MRANAVDFGFGIRRIWKIEESTLLGRKGNFGAHVMQVTNTAKNRQAPAKKPGFIGWLLLAPMALWLCAFVVAPTAILLVASFTSANEDTGFPVYKQPPAAEGEAQKATYGAANYKRIVVDDEGKLLTEEDEDIVNEKDEVVGTKKVTRFAAPYLRVFGYSLLYAGVATFLCIVIGYPVAWFIGRARENVRNTLLMFVMIPFWTSFLIRTYAWITILAEEGLLNGMLQYTKVISEPFQMLYTPAAVVLGLVYNYLPFMILPIYGSVEKLDNSLVEAAFDLGAGPVRAFQRVILPLTRPGIVAGIMLVFVPAVGMFAISSLMGGGKSPMIGDVIANQFFAGRDWPFGSALGMTLVLMFILAFLATSRLRKAVADVE
jgi:spermidine/putrescine transport system permease protein